MKTITLTGGAAVTAMRMIAKARAQYPILVGATDEEILKLLVGASLAKEGPA